MASIESRLKELGIILPKPAAPVANYAPALITGNLLFVSGQLPFDADGKIAPGHIGKLGLDLFNEAGQEAARVCAINLLAQAKAALGSPSRIADCMAGLRGWSKTPAPQRSPQSLLIARLNATCSSRAMARRSCFMTSALSG